MYSREFEYYMNIAANSQSVNRQLYAQLATAEATMEVARQLARQTELLLAAPSAARNNVPPQGENNGRT